MTMMPEIDDGLPANVPNTDAETASVSVPFSALSPETLKNQREDLTVRLRIGNTDPVSMDITLPPPSKSDLKTAAAAHQMTAEKRQNLIRSSIEKNNLWLTAYMCSVQRSEDFFDPDFKYTSSVPFKADRSLLALACHDGAPETVGLLLQTDGINVNNGSGNYQYGLPIWAAVTRKDAESRDRIITMLGCHKELYIDNYYLKHVPTKTMREFLTKTQERNKTYLPSAHKLKALAASTAHDAQKTADIDFATLCLSPARLLEQKDAMAVAFTIGDDKKTWVFDIPAPTASDLKTASRMEKMSTQKRQKLIRKAVMQQKTWLVAYMHSVWHERDSDISWFDPNHQYRFEFAQSCTLPALSVCDGNSTITAIALQYPDIKLNSTHYSPFFNPLFAAITHKDETHSKTAVEMLCCFHDLDIADARIADSRTQDMYDFLKLTQARNNKPRAVDNATKAAPEKAAKKRKAIAESAVTDTETGTVWEKIDNATICKLSLAENAAYRLRRVFNFKSGTLSEVHEYLNEDGQVQTATAQNITPFNKLGSSREVAEAQAQLKLMIPARNTAKVARHSA